MHRVLRLVIALAVGLCSSAALAGSPFVLAITKAEARYDAHSGQPVLAIHLTEASQKSFGKFTKINVGRRADLMVDGAVVSSPIIQMPIFTPVLQISGLESMAEARELAILLRRGDAFIEVRLSAE